jgi:hypothetical protein
MASGFTPVVLAIEYTIGGPIKAIVSLTAIAERNPKINAAT